MNRVRPHPIDLATVSSIGLVKMSAIGDVVWTVPMVRLLRKRHPSITIKWIIDDRYYPLVEGMEQEGIEFVVVDKPKSLMDYVSLIATLKKLDLDVLLCAQVSLRINLLYPFIKARWKIGMDSTRGRDGHRFVVHQQIPYRIEHQMQNLLGFARYLGISEFDDHGLECNLPIADHDRSWAQEKLRGSNPWVGINPKASHSYKTWRVERYQQLIAKIMGELTCSIVLTGAPSDRPMIAKILAHQQIRKYENNILNLVGKTNLKQLAAIMSDVKLVIAPDTGPIHVASAMGTPTLGLYAAVPPEFTGPYNGIHQCINKYPEAVSIVLKKTAEQVRFGTRVKSPRIMDLIGVDEVFQKVKILLG